jgi:hypothetical protein
VSRYHSLGLLKLIVYCMVNHRQGAVHLPGRAWEMELKGRAMAPTIRPSDGLKVLVRQDPLTSEDWVALLESRRQQIKPMMKIMTLPPLAEVSYRGRWLRDRNYLLMDESAWASQIIAGQDWAELDEDHERTWLLTRKGAWHWLVIGLDPQSRWRRQSTGQSRERPLVTVALEPATPHDFAAAGLDLRRIWQSLERLVAGWLDRRRQQLKAVEGLAAQMEAESAALEAWRACQDRATRA